MTTTATSTTQTVRSCVVKRYAWDAPAPRDAVTASIQSPNASRRGSRRSRPANHTRKRFVWLSAKLDDIICQLVRLKCSALILLVFLWIPTLRIRYTPDVSPHVTFQSNDMWYYITLSCRLVLS